MGSQDSVTPQTTAAELLYKGLVWALAAPDRVTSPTAESGGKVMRVEKP